MSGSGRGKLGKIGLAFAFLFAASSGGGLWYWASLRESQYQTAAEREAKYEGRTARERVKLECAVPGVPEAECRERVEYAASEAQERTRDLEAQQSMAVWTKAMGIAAVIGMAVGTLGLGLIFFTFRETRRAADAAHDANRPWLSVDLIEFSRFSISDDGVTAALKLKVENIGRAPATRVMATMQLVSVPERLPRMPRGKAILALNEVFDQWKSCYRATGRTVFPDRHFEQDCEIEVPHNDPNMTHDGEGMFFIAIGVQYTFGGHIGRSCTEYYLVLQDGECATISTEVLGDIPGSAFSVSETYAGYAT